MMEGYSLDFASELEKATEESRAAAKVVVSEWGTVEYEIKTGDNAGQQASSVVWKIEWELLDRQVDFNFKSNLFMPDPNRQTFSRKLMPYYLVTQAFNELGIKGGNPEDFLGATCVIEDTPEIRNKARTYWKPIAKYSEGQTVSEALSSKSGEVDLSIKETPESLQAEENEMPATGDEFKDLVLTNSVGKTVRAASRGLLAMDSVKNNEEWSSQIQSGAIFDTLEEDKYMKEENNKYVLVSNE